MERSSSEAVGTGSPWKRTAQVLILAAIAGLVTYTAGKALWSAFASDDFPEALGVKVELLPLIFPIHMITGGLALLLLPLALVLRHRPTWHRPIGRLAAVDVLISGLTAFPVAWAAPVTVWSAAGFTAQATTWLVLLVLGIRAIRQRRIATHRTCMILMVATTSGAVFFRIYLALWALFGTRRQFDTFYACDAWIAWLLPLALTALVIGGFSGSFRPLRAPSLHPARK
jgi:uncharacterized membrane protein YozB (DUF420 family)